MSATGQSRMKPGNVAINTKTGVVGKVISIERDSSGEPVVVTVRPRRQDGAWSGLSYRWSAARVRVPE